jgi:queuine tRNA-ribosyltransferase
VETLYGPEAEAVKPYSHLDQAIAGYTVDLVPLFLSLAAAEQKSVPESEEAVEPSPPQRTEAVVPLVKASLEQLPIGKPRLVNSTQNPHEILRLISSIGVDLFDAHWPQRASDFGIALDFQFPVPKDGLPSSTAPGKKMEMGHNIYDFSYAHDFSPLAESFRGASQTDVPAKTICVCAACSPVQPLSRLYHGVDNEAYSGDPPPPEKKTYLPPFTRAYVHHLLHTHEMSAHTLLAMHNLAVLEAFLAGVREVLQRKDDPSWEEEVARFMDTYDEGLQVLEEAKVRWKEVDLARGKGRLAREKAKEEEPAAMPA